MNVKANKNEGLFHAEIMGLDGNIDGYFDATLNWLKKKDHSGLRNVANIVPINEVEKRIDFDFRRFIDEHDQWKIFGHSIIRFEEKEDSININIEVVLSRNKLTKWEHNWGEYLNFLQFIEDYIGILGIVFNEQLFNELYNNSETTIDLVSQLRSNIFQDIFLISFILIFYLISWSLITLLVSLSGLILVLAYSYRDVRLYRQLTRFKLKNKDKN